MSDEVRLAIAALCVFGGVVWFAQTWARMRYWQRETDHPVSGYWGRVSAREQAKRKRAELCGALLVVMTGVLLGLHALR